MLFPAAIQFAVNFSSALSLNTLIPLPIDIQAERADIVLVGQAGDLDRCASNVGVVDCIKISNPAIIKGQTVAGDIWFLLNMGVDEARVPEPESGKSYLFFAYKLSDGKLYAVNGKYSVLEIEMKHHSN